VYTNDVTHRDKGKKSYSSIHTHTNIHIYRMLYIKADYIVWAPDATSKTNFQVRHRRWVDK